jgi:PIN domain nuclease of toxin-antitoxin system
LRLLLDTCTFLWAVDETQYLSRTARQLLTDPENDVFLSAVSAWEIAVKQANGRLVLAEPAHGFVPTNRQAHGFLELPLDEDAVLHLGRLPSPHRDPFDRMLVCQAIAHNLAILTPDAQIALYPVRTIW